MRSLLWPVAEAAAWAQKGLSGSRLVLTLRVEALDDALEAQRLVARIRSLKAGGPVVALFLYLDAAPGGWSDTHDLREALVAADREGIAVFAFLEAASNATLWLASACRAVFLVPVGEVAFVGVGAELTFFGGLLERLGVQPDFEAAGAYKSFGEAFTRTHASAANLEAMSALVAGLQHELVRGVAAGRRLEEAAVQALCAAGPLSASAAREAGLVDHLMYEDEALKWVEAHCGASARVRPFSGWAWRQSWVDRLRDASGSQQQIVVLFLEGSIVTEGDGRRVSIEARTVCPMLKALRENEQVRAVVLHVDSPGGSALASDVIWREVELLSRAKPVIASFGDTAASGGYYLSAPAVEIVARPTTLTGSIGVFGGKLVLGRGAAKWGVHAQSILGAPLAGMFSPARPFNDAERVSFRASLERFYNAFVARVAAGRRAPVEQVEPACRGRVWTGEDAHARGLVDRVGGLEVAVEAARARCSLPKGGYRLKFVAGRASKGLLSTIVASVVRPYLPGAALSWIAEDEARLRLLSAGEPLAMLPFELRLR